MELIAGVTLWLGGCDSIFGVDFSNPRLREGGGGAGAGSGAESGSGGATEGCDVGFPDSTPFCVSTGGFEIPCGEAPHCAGHWVDAGPKDRFELTGSDILDRVTGLSWRSDVLSASDRHGCPDGYELPSRLELLSIVDYGRWSPAVDTSVFPGQRGVFATGSIAEQGVWVVDFETGAFRIEPADYPASRRCKAGVWDPKLGPVAGTDETLREAASGLLFRRKAIYATGFSDAGDKCALLPPSPCGPFRAPSVKEMFVAIRDDGRIDPALDGFPSTADSRVLTSSPRRSELAPQLWTISLRTGETEPIALDDTSTVGWGVYCVSGGVLHD